MIRRLYVDNFRSLVNFTWEPGEETLVLGYNGSGKTSVFDALSAIRNWALGARQLAQAISTKDRSRFSNKDEIRFRLELSTEADIFHYSVAFGFIEGRDEATCTEEKLSSKAGAEFHLIYGDLKYRNSEHDDYQWASLPATQSAISFLQASKDALFVKRFFSSFASIINVRPIPLSMKLDAEKPQESPLRTFENFVAWYWNYSTNGAYGRGMLGLLENVWPEFDHLKMERLGRESWGLSAVFKGPETSSGELALDFYELSDGERMLLVLYSLIAYQKSQPPTTIIIDEPDNFVSLLELQPWLRTLLDTRPDGGQVILVSHNPEIIQTMGEERVAWFSRKDHLSPTQVSTLVPDESGFSLSDRLARGWIDA